MLIFADRCAACRHFSPIAFPIRGARVLFRCPCLEGVLAKHRLPAPTNSVRDFRAKKPRRSAILEKLGKTGDRRRNLADKLVSGLLADIGEDLPPDCLHFAHAEAKTSEPARQANDAAAHRAD